MRRFEGKRLLVATHNAGKLEEVRALLAPYGVEVVGAAEMKLAEPEETEDTHRQRRIKARAAVKATGLPALADDSGISVDALNGAPGVYTADWAETGQGRDFGMAMERTWRELEAANAPAPGWRSSAVHWCLHGPTGTTSVSGYAAGPGGLASARG